MAPSLTLTVSCGYCLLWWGGEDLRLCCGSTMYLCISWFSEAVASSAGQLGLDINKVLGELIEEKSPHDVARAIVSLSRPPVLGTAQ